MSIKIRPALPVTLAEHEWLIGDGSLAGAMAGVKMPFVYCQCGVTPKGKDWQEHPRRYPGARYLDDNGPHEAIAFERVADWVNDCMVWLDSTPLEEPEWLA